VTEDIHEPAPWYWEAGSTKCPHGAEPDEDSPEWDAWSDRHVWSPQDVSVCLDAPMGDVCEECSANHGEAVPWSACDAQAHAHPKPGTKFTPGAHEPVEVWTGTTECLERECEEYATDDGDDRPDVERCSHIGVELLCGGCSTLTADGYYEPAVSWPGPGHAPART
jgi:hypothetical protein